MSNLTSRLNPVNGYILINSEKVEQTSAIIINKEKEDAYIRGKVVKVGGPIFDEGVEIIPPCKVGDSVLYSFSGFEEVTINGESIRVVKFSNIVGVFNE